MALIHVALEKGIPLLAICGGHQILNVYLGGKLSAIQDEDLEAQGYMEYSSVKFDENSEMAKIFKLTKHNNVGSFFGAHQYLVSQLGGINRLMNDDLLTISGRAVDHSGSNVKQ